MQDRKQFAVNLTAKTISLGLNLLISFFLTPFIIRHVGTESYGFVGLANDFVDVARIAAVALNSMALRFIAVHLYRGETEHANRYFSSVILVNFLLSLIFLLPFGGMILFLDKLFAVSAGILSDVRLLWTFIFLNFLLTITGSTFSVALFAKNRIDKESFRSAESVALRAVFLFVCYSVFAPKVYYVGISYCVLTVYVLITNLYYTKKYLPELSVSRKYFDKSAVKTLFASGGWNCLTKIATILSTGLDLLFVNLFVGKLEMGVVSISKTMPATVLSVFVILSGVFLPKLTESYSKNDRDGIIENTVFSVKLLGALAAIPLVIVGVFGDTFYSLWTPTENAGFLWLLSILGGISYTVSLATQNLWNIFTVTNRVKTSSIGLLATAGVSVLTVLCSMLFVTDGTTRILIIVGCSAFYHLLMTVTFLPVQAAKSLQAPAKTFYIPMAKSTGLLLCLVLLFIGVKALIPVSSWGSFIGIFFAVSICSVLFGYILLLDQKEKKALAQLCKREKTKE